MKLAYTHQKNSDYLLPVILIVAFVAQCIVYIPTLHTWLDEGIYLMKSWRYVTGQIQPYSNQDSTQYMPFYFYLLGYWQQLFGRGHFSGRILSALLAFGVLCILYLSGNSCWKEKKVGIIAVVLMLISPFAIKLYCTATQYAPVALLNAAVFFLILQQRRLPPAVSSVLVGAGFCGLYFFRPNMIAGIALYFAYQIIVFPEKRVVRSIITIATAAGISALLFLIFGKGLMLQSLDLPVVVHFLAKAFPHSWYGLRNYLNDPSLNGTHNLAYSIECFVKNFLLFYAFILIPCISSVVHAIRKGKTLQPESFAAGYFIVMVLFNFLGSQSYEPAIIKHYTAYFLPVGALAASVEYFRLYNGFLRTGKKPVLLIFMSLLLLLSGVYAGVALIRQIKRAQNNESDFVKINTLSKKINAYIPSDTPVLIIGNNCLMAQTLLICDRIPEIATINYCYSRVSLKPAISPALKYYLREELKKRSLWDDEIMSEWIRNKHKYIIFCKEPSTMVWLTEVNRFFKPIAVLSESIDTCILYQRYNN